MMPLPTLGTRNILIIDDDADNRELLQEFLRPQFQVLQATDGEEGLRLARSRLPDLILLDIRMPKVDGIQTCDQLRQNEATRHIPVIMLTGADDSESRVQAFSRGADDFVSRPFRSDELIARIQSKLRRIEEREGTSKTLVCGNLTLDLPKIEARIADRHAPLSVLEFDLLKYFVQNKEQVMSRERILEAVWRDSVVSDRTVDTHIALLRKKLKGFDHAIGTVYGAGYILKPANP